MCLGLFLAGCCSPQDQPTSASTRIGTYDSRAVALAYWHEHDRLNQYIKPLMQQAQDAKDAGNTQRFQELAQKLRAHQELLHQQVFSTEPIDDILDSLPDRLAHVTAQADVTALVSKWDKQSLQRYKSAQLIDVTDLIVAQFSLTNEKLETIRQIQTQAPVSPSTLRQHPLNHGH